jgi:murein DD-endopeptidase MepM/ murein hydrolase activator NlpD
MKNLLFFALIAILISCNGAIPAKIEVKPEPVIPKIIEKFGFVYNNYKVIEDTIRKGESFGEILYRNHIEYPEVYKIVEKAKDSFDVRKLRTGRPYTILAKKDSTEKAQIFIYQPSKVRYEVVDFTDSVIAHSHKKRIKTVIKTSTGIIKTSLSEAVNESGLDYDLVNEMSEIYAWTIDFFHLQKNDKFKVIYEEKYIDDSVYVGIGQIKAAYFENNKNPFYAFEYITDSLKRIPEYFDDKSDNLRRAFLRAPLRYSRISSRFNLRRYIKYYGRIKPHKGTDFAASIGTPIVSTADGRVIESRRNGGNGNYVKIRHNSTYTTQYLHMRKRKVKVGDYVKQGDVIGYVGMTGNTSGPHVCYRFWKNGRQVDPFRQKLPSAKPIKKDIKERYLKYIQPIKEQLDNIALK